MGMQKLPFTKMNKSAYFPRLNEAKHYKAVLKHLRNECTTAVLLIFHNFLKYFYAQQRRPTGMSA